MRLTLIAVASLLIATALPEQVAADVGPGGEWVLTGAPAPPTPPGDFGRLITLSDGSGLLVGSPVQRYHRETGQWTKAGSLVGAVSLATVLADGRVLVTASPSAELYDPAAGTSSPTASMYSNALDTKRRCWHRGTSW